MEFKFEIRKVLTDVSTILKNAAKLHIISQITKHFKEKNVTLASPKVLSLENAQIYLAFYSLIRTFNYVEIRLHLGNIQINLVFHSICTNFAPK